MSTRSTSEARRVRYLLGMSSPAEREQIESEYFEDEDAFAEMLTAEDDLIDAYARGELAGIERDRFENIFVSSLNGRDRVQFARAFGRALSAPWSVETKRSITLLEISKTFRSPRFLRTATIAAVIVLVAIIAWLVIDRRRMTNEFRKLNAKSVELRTRTEALQQARDVEIAPHLADPRDQADKPKHRESKTTATQRARHLPRVKNIREKVASSKRKPAANFTNTQNSLVLITDLPVSGRRWASPSTPQSATTRDNSSLVSGKMTSGGGSTVSGSVRDVGDNGVSGATVTLSDRARNFTRTQSTNSHGAYVFKAIPRGTYSLEIEALGFKRAVMQLKVGDVCGAIPVSSAAEASINTSDASLGNSFERKHITELPLSANNTAGLLSLQPGVTRTGSVNAGRADQSNITLDGGDATILIPNSRSWIRFQIALKSVALHEYYRVTIKTTDGHPITSVNWIEPLTPNQTIIDTPVISTTDLPSGDYVLLMTGKDRDGSIVKVAEYFFKVTRY